MNEQKIAVITDTGTDTPADFAAAHDVRTVALVINYSNGDSFRSGFEINSSEVIDRFAKEIPTTSPPRRQPNARFPGNDRRHKERRHRGGPGCHGRGPHG